MGQTRSRSIIKAATWRAIATLTGVGIVLLLTGEMEHGVTFAVADVSLKMMFYYMLKKQSLKVFFLWTVLDMIQLQ